MCYLYFRGKYHGNQVCQFNLLGFSLWSDRPLTAYLLIEEIFLREIYKVSIKSTRPLIVDAGANIGLALFYFKYWYPDAKITAYEPQAELFSILEKNVRDNMLEDVSLINGCLSGEKGTVKLFRSSSRLNHTLIVPLQNPNFDLVKSYRLSDTISEQKVDLVKLDIEGAETEVVRELSERSLLGNSAYYIIELHKVISSSTIDRLHNAFEIAGFRSRRIDTAASGKEYSDQVWSFERPD